MGKAPQSSTRKRVAIIATASPSSEFGGAERFYEGLKHSLCDQDVLAELVPVIPDESSFKAILRSYLQVYDLDLTRFDGVISTKAPGYLARHPNHVCYLLHTMRAFYDMFDTEFPSPDENAIANCQRIREMDSAALRSPNIRHIFVIGEEVRDRLLHFNGLESEVLYPTTTLSGFRRGSFDYLFMPGRLHRWKRVDLVIRAMALVRRPLRLLISGTGEDEAGFKELARDDSRISFLGRVSDQELLDLYANALAVPFVPRKEDFGLVAVEAFHCGKPVITCSDSGEPARMVSRFKAGIVCPANIEAIADAIECLSAAPEEARRLGENGRLKVAEINWESTAKAVIGALGFCRDS